MSALSHQNAVVTRGLTRDFSSAQLKLIRRSVARSCTDSEFDEFIECARSSGLDPLRRQLAPLIVAADDPIKRRLIPWTTIDGLRVLAARQGDYRPMEAAPTIEQDSSRTDPETNPLGITRAEVRAWKLSDGVWHPVAGEAWWDEYAPIREERERDPTNEAASVTRAVVDASWKRMGRVMIAKCAEAQALRRGWPDVLSGLYGEEELHRLRHDEKTASERLRANEEQAVRAHRKRSQTLWFIFEPGGAYEPVIVEHVLGRLAAFYCGAADCSIIERFNQTNWSSLQTLWEWAPSDALALKRIVEARLAGGAATVVTFPATVESAP